MTSITNIRIFCDNRPLGSLKMSQKVQRKLMLQKLYPQLILQSSGYMYECYFKTQTIVKF